MDYPVYDGTQLPGHVSLLKDGNPVVRAAYSKVSAVGAILNSKIELSRDALFDVVLELQRGRPRELKAHVLRSGHSGLFLAWSPPDPELHDELDRFLSEALLTRVRRPSDDLDTNLALRSRTRAVSALHLASRHKTVHVLDLRTIQELIDKAVSAAVDALPQQLNEDQQQALREESEAIFEQQMADLRAEKAGMAEKVELLASQLTTAENTLAEERARIIAADRFTVSDSGMTELEQRLQRTLENLIRSGRMPASLQDDLRSMINHLLDDERSLIADQARSAQSDTLELLERKVSRLADTLMSTQAERDQARAHAHALEATSSPARVQTVLEPGLADADPHRAEKLQLLKELVQDNRSLREFVKSRDAS